MVLYGREYPVAHLAPVATPMTTSPATPMTTSPEHTLTSFSFSSSQKLHVIVDIGLFKMIAMPIILVTGTETRMQISVSSLAENSFIYISPAVLQKIVMVKISY